MTIAICDDEKEIQDALERNIKMVCKDGEIVKFYDGQSLLDYPDAIDILFLDIKPFSQEKFIEVLEGAIRERSLAGQLPCKEMGKSVLIKSKNSHIKIFLDDIVYAEVFSRKVVIHTENQEIEYYGKLAELEKLAGEDFFRPHRSYLVNFKYIIRYDAKTIHLETGEALIAKQKYPEFVKRYLQYNRRMI